MTSHSYSKLVFSALLAALFVIVGVQAATVIHDDWHPYSDFFTVQGDYYEITTNHMYGEDSIPIQAFFKRNQVGFIISAQAVPYEDNFAIMDEKCARDGYYRYCMVNISLDPAKGARSDSAGVYRYGTRYRVELESPDAALLKVEREIVHDKQFFVDERLTIRLRIKNNGTKTASEVSVVETVGPGLEVISFDAYNYRQGNLLLKDIPFIRINEEVILDYQVRVTDYVNTTELQADIAYLSPDPATVTQKKSYTIPFPFTTSLTMSPTTMKTTQQSTLTYKLSNKDQTPLSMNVNINVPEGLLVTARSPLVLSGQSLVYSGVVDALTDLTLTAIVKSPFTDAFTFQATSNVRVNDESFSDTKTTTLTTKNDKITPRISPSKHNMRSGDSLHIDASVTNDDSAVPYMNIQGWVASSWFNDTFNLPRLSAGTTENVLFKMYTPPRVNEPQRHTIYMQGSFQSSSGQVETFSTQKEILIIPQNQSLMFIQSVTPTTVMRGDEVVVVVSVENVADVGYSVVSARDTYSKGLTKTFGDTGADLNLFGGEKKQFYMYKLRVPFDWARPQFSVATAYYDQGVLASLKQVNITVSDYLDQGIGSQDDDFDIPEHISGSPLPPSDEDAVNESEEEEQEAIDEDETTEESPDQDEEQYVFPEPQENFFVRLVKSISNFFTGFFS
jgi:hypothetical protein